jgi:signal transduction histidine kinase
MSGGKYSEALVVTTQAADADLVRSILREGGVSTRVCGSVKELCARIAQGAGCVVIVEEALRDEEMPALRESLDAQPAWSDIPLVLLAGEDTELRSMVERAFPNSGNITLLTRPLNPLTLLSAVEVGLRARHRQVQVRDLLSQREEAVRQRDEFVAMLAHELRNPLAPMRNAVYLQKTLADGNELFAKTRDIIERQIVHLSRIVDDLLDVARLERGKVRLQIQRLDLNDAVTAAVESCLPITQAAGHAVEVDLSPQPLPLDADAVRIEQLLANFITNAAKFTPRGGRIQVRTRRDGPNAEVAVHDTGIGIRPDRIDAMFNPFTQGDQTLARSAGGLGIGLTVARRIAHLHAGEVSARSAGPGKGTTFFARFPLAPGAEAGKKVVRAKAASPCPKRVLVVDDNADIRDSLGTMLRLWGHDVSVAATGEKAVELALHDHPDVALVDIGLPGISGYEVAREIRRVSPEWNSSIKLVAITGYGQPSDREQALASGFDRHMMKPVDPAQLERVFRE